MPPTFPRMLNMQLVFKFKLSPQSFSYDYFITIKVKILILFLTLTYRQIVPIMLSIVVTKFSSCSFCTKKLFILHACNIVYIFLMSMLHLHLHQENTSNSNQVVLKFEKQINICHVSVHSYVQVQPHFTQYGEQTHL